MISIEKTIGGKRVQFDLDSAPIGKTFAKRLNRQELFAEMHKLGIPGISSNEGWQDLALKLAEWNYLQRESVLPGDQTNTVAASSRSAA